MFLICDGKWPLIGLEIVTGPTSSSWLSVAWNPTHISSSQHSNLCTILQLFNAETQMELGSLLKVYQAQAEFKLRIICQFLTYQVFFSPWLHSTAIYYDVPERESLPPKSPEAHKLSPMSPVSVVWFLTHDHF